MPEYERLLKELISLLQQLASQRTGPPPWMPLVAAIFGAGIGGYLGGYYKDHFERKRRAEQREQLRQLLYKDMTRIFGFLVAIYRNLSTPLPAHVVEPDSWKNKKEWLPTHLSSLGFTQSEKDVLLFTEIAEADRIYVTFQNMRRIADIDETDPLLFHIRLQVAFHFFEDEFKKGNLDQDLIIKNASKWLKPRLLEMKDGTRHSVEDSTNALLSQNLGQPLDWWDTFEHPVAPQEPWPTD
jgi:hypothetical protein